MSFIEAMIAQAAQKTNVKDAELELNTFKVALSNRSIPLEAQNFTVYLELNSLFNSREIAIRLMTIFGDYKAAIDYLKKLEKQCKSYKELIEKLNDLPVVSPNTPWNVKLWQELAKRNMPNGAFEKVLRYAGEIEKYVEKNEEKLKDGIAEKIKKRYTALYEKQWEDIQDNVVKNTQEGYIALHLETKKNEIRKEVCLRFNKKMHVSLGIAFSSSLTEEDKKNIEIYRSSNDEIRNEIEKQVTAEYANKYREEYQAKNCFAGLCKKEYVEKRLIENDRAIKNDCKNANKNILSPHTDVAMLEKYGTYVAYPSAEINPEAAELFFHYDLSAKIFTHYLSFEPKDDETKVPNVYLDCADIGYPDFYMEKLSSHSPLAGVLGKLTGCCQWLGHIDGSGIVIEAINNPSCGFYVLRRKDNNEIIAQSLAWRGRYGSLVFDSIESINQYREDKMGEGNPMVSHCFSMLANHLVMSHSIFDVRVGNGGNTPFTMKGNRPKRGDILEGYRKYTDAIEQHIVFNQQEIKKNINNLLLRAGKNEDLVRYCLAQGADFTVALHVAIENDLTTVLHFLESQDKHFSANNEKGETPLHLAIRYNQVEAIPLLLNRGVDVNASNKAGETPLHYAASLGKANIAKMLLAKGANCDAPNLLWQTPLHYAAMSHSSSLDVAKSLVRYGANVNARDCLWTTPLYRAATSNADIAMGEFLVANKAIVHTRDISGFTAQSKCAVDSEWYVYLGSISRPGLAMSAFPAVKKGPELSVAQTPQKAGRDFSFFESRERERSLREPFTSHRSPCFSSRNTSRVHNMNVFFPKAHYSLPRNPLQMAGETCLRRVKGKIR